MTQAPHRPMIPASARSHPTPTELPAPAPRSGTALDAALVLACLIGCVALFFRLQLGSHFRLLISDRYDGIIETAILEHWLNVWRGLTPFNQTFFFYPVGDTLGYNDGYFLYGCLYAVFRTLGLDPFLSSESVDICLVVVGFFAFYACARVVFGLKVAWAALGAGLFMLSSNIYLHAVHAQLLSVALAPLLATILYALGVALVESRRRRAAVLGVAAVMLHAAWLLSTFYMAWFFVFFSLFVVLAAALLHPRGIRPTLALVADNKGLSVALLAAYALVNVPFAMVYLPKLVETGQHRYEVSLTYVPSVLDMFNVGPDNLVFGPLYRAASGVFRPGSPDFSEKTTGFPLLLLALFVASTLSLVRGRSGGIARVVALGTCLSWLCIIEIHHHTLWWAIYQVVPGAKTVRVVSRYQIFLSFPVTMLALAYLQRLHLRHRWGRFAPPALAALCAVLVLEQLSWRGNVGLDRSAELARLRSVPPHPAACRSFFASRSREGATSLATVDGGYSHNVDAMMLAEYTRFPTLNGMDTFVPQGWNLVNPFETDRYLADVQTFALAHDLTDVCSLDFPTMRWNTAPFDAPRPVGDPPASDCDGHFDTVRTPRDLGIPAVDVMGWAVRAEGAHRAPDRITMRVQEGASAPRYLGAGVMPRPDVATALGDPAALNSGFRSVVPTKLREDLSVVPVLRYGDEVLACANLGTTVKAEP